jgi:hypothetical protein
MATSPNPTSPDSWQSETPLRDLMLLKNGCTQLEFQQHARVAFENAIQAGRLSGDVQAHNYAGDYMFMGYDSETYKALFKHIDTRQYIA